MNVLLIGSGATGLEYLKVLNKLLPGNFDVLAKTMRGKDKVLALGARKFLTWSDDISWHHYERVIICVPIIDTSTVLSAVMRVYGGKILFEKPGFLTPRALGSFVNIFPDSFDRAYVAFNRVFYPSVIAVKNFIQENKPLSAHMDMSEWVSGLATENFPISVLERWGIANSIHMLSVMYALFPNIALERRNRVFPSQLLWHPTGDTFYGIFMSQDKDMYLSYQANWVGAGRFSINLNFRHISFKLSPLQNLERSHNYIDSSCDHFDVTKFKIGFYEMVNDFLGQNTTIQKNCNLKVLAKCLGVAEQVFFYDTTK